MFYPLKMKIYYTSNKVSSMGGGGGLWCLTPLSTIF